MTRKVSDLDASQLTNTIIDQVLFHDLDDQGEPMDWLLVLGSLKAHQYRVPKAVEIMQSGRCDQMILSGGRLIEIGDLVASEANHMAKSAIAKGICPSKVHLEEASMYTLDNMDKSCELLETLEAFDAIKTIGLVTTHYHMRRSLLMARARFPHHVKIFPCPGQDSSTRRDTWYLSEQGIKRARGEVLKIIECIQAGLIEDFTIQG